VKAQEMALKPQIFADPGDDQGMQRASTDLDEAKKALLSSLENRNRLFDPSLMALAIGLGKPTRSGAFGEAVSNALEGYLPVAENERKREQELAGMRFELAQNALGQAQNRAAMRLYLDAYGKPIAAPANDQTGAVAQPGVQPSGAVTAPVAEPFAEQPAQPQSPLAAASGAGQQPAQAPRSTNLGFGWAEVNRLHQTIPRIAMMDPAKAEMMRKDVAAMTQALQKEQELRQNAVSLVDGFVFNKETGATTPVYKENETGKLTLPGLGTFDNVPVKLVAQYNIAMMNGDTAGMQRIANMVQNPMAQQPKLGLRGELPNLDQQPALPLAEPGQPMPQAAQRVPSLEERKQAEEREKAYGVEMAKTDAATTAKMLEQGEPAKQVEASSKRIITNILQNPDVIGVLRKVGVGSALSEFFKEQEQAGAKSIDKDQIANFMIKIRAVPGVTDKDLTALDNIFGDLAYQNLNFRKVFLSGQGQGAITNMEAAIIPRMTGSTSMTPEAFVERQQLLGLRARFDAQVSDGFAKALDANPGLSARKYKQGDEYKSLMKQYEANLAQAFPQYVSGKREAAAPAQAPAAAPRPAAQASGAAQQKPMSLYERMQAERALRKPLN
jgi:hypothetical protein